jgi:hypothetical protein
MKQARSKIITTALLFFTVTVFAQTLHLYSQQGNDLIYLGCLNCNSYDSNSIWNEYGDYGSPYDNRSIWNEYGTYGSEYNSDSPWNEYASNPPVVLDNNGTFYGYFTANKYQSKRAEFDLALTLYKYHDLIRDNVSAWYRKIFE